MTAPGLSILRGCDFLGEDAPASRDYTLSDIPGVDALPVDKRPEVFDAIAQDLIQRFGTSSVLPGILRDPQNWGATFSMTPDEFAETVSVFHEHISAANPAGNILGIAALAAAAFLVFKG